MKRWVAVLIVAVVHFVLVVTLSLATFELSGVFFGVWPPPSEGAWHHFMSGALVVLMFPLGPVVNLLPSALRFLAWPLVAVNGLLWATIICLLVFRMRAARR